MSTFLKAEVHSEMGVTKLGIGVKLEFAQVNSVLGVFDVFAECEVFLGGHGVWGDFDGAWLSICGLHRKRVSAASILAPAFRSVVPAQKDESYLGRYDRRPHLEYKLPENFGALEDNFWRQFILISSSES